jgi:hypothetical protein
MFGLKVNNKCLEVILRRMLKKESVRLRLNVNFLEQTQQRAGVDMKMTLLNFITVEEFLD